MDLQTIVYQKIIIKIFTQISSRNHNLSLHDGENFLGPAPSVPNAAGNVVEHDVDLGRSDPHGHEALPVVIEPDLLRMCRPIHHPPPRLRPTAARQKLDWATLKLPNYCGFC